MRGRNIALGLSICLVVWPLAEVAASGFLLKGKEYYKKGLHDLAIAELEQVIKDNPKRAEAYFYLGMIQFARGAVDSAMLNFQKALAMDYFLPGGHYALGICLKKKGDFTAAEKEFQKAVKTEPSQAKNYFNWGVCLTRLGQYNEAIYAFQHSLSLDRDNVYNHYNLADVYRLTANYHEAIIHYEATLRKKPVFVPAHVGKGQCLAALQRNEEALVEFLEAIELEPRNTTARDLIVSTYEKLGQPEKARRYKELEDLPALGGK